MVMMNVNGIFIRVTISVNSIYKALIQPNAPIDSSKILVILNWPLPTSLKALRGFLGHTCYYRKFVKHYGILAQPLTHLLKNGVMFSWGLPQQHAFELIKQALEYTGAGATRFQTTFCP
jgi:hypothetical protein